MTVARAIQQAFYSGLQGELGSGIGVEDGGVSMAYRDRIRTIKIVQPKDMHLGAFARSTVETS